MVRAVLTVLLSVIVAGCATLGVRTEGESGPLAWQSYQPQVYRYAWGIHGLLLHPRPPRA